jgi:hypothetical protein
MAALGHSATSWVVLTREFEIEFSTRWQDQRARSNRAVHRSSTRPRCRGTKPDRWHRLRSRNAPGSDAVLDAPLDPREQALSPSAGDHVAIIAWPLMPAQRLQAVADSSPNATSSRGLSPVLETTMPHRSTKCPLSTILLASPDHS